MTHVSDSTIKQFRLAFPEMAHYSDMEVTAFCRNMKREKKAVDRSIERSVKKYEKRRSR